MAMQTSPQLIVMSVLLVLSAIALPRVVLFAVCAVLLPSLVRELILQFKTWRARYFRGPFPVRRVAAFPVNVESIFFAGNGADARQSMRAYGVFPHSARVLGNPVPDLMSVEPADILAISWFRLHVWWRVNLAQRRDVTRALAYVRRALARNPYKRLVLFGSSRGAAVCLQVAAQLSAEEIKRIPMIVCEAPFTTVEDVINTRFAGLHNVQAFVRFVLRWFTSYDARMNDTWSPLAAATDFPHKQLPIVLVRSAIDTVVPPHLTAFLGSVLRGAHVKNVHDIVLQHSAHSDFTSDNDEDRKHYVEELNVLYKKYL
jgi:pimeloyl-ACP methyl ester carboxylesterase